MQVTDRIDALEATKGNYAYLIRGSETVLIDTGRPGQGDGILRELKAMNVIPTEINHILLTHYDTDHVGNAALLQRATGAKVWAPAADIPYIQGRLKRPGIKKIFGYLFKMESPGEIHPYIMDQPVAGCEVIPTPGHSPGHVCLRYQDTLFVGDLVVMQNGKVSLAPAFISWDSVLARESVKRVADLPVQWICPAHGAPFINQGQLKQL